ncbi:MAG TPA: superoxide dismutase [Flavobacterium sp.]|jgi:Fe-Mn family superoxide dismutase
MRILNLSVSCILFLLLQSCKEKKLIEVEVPLPRTEEKIIMRNPDDVKADEGSFSLIKLPYKYNDLEPYIDTKTMEIHYSKHYLNYTNSLNKAIIGTLFEKATIEEILTQLDVNDAGLRNNAGGYYNHNLYWEIMAPKAEETPKDPIAAAITKDFGSYEVFKAQFSDAAAKQFGSGWAWLVVDEKGTLQVTSTANQDNPLMPNAIVKGKPILALDVWEHAYYLQYQNKRKDYINAFFKVINWKKVNEKYLEALQK